MVHGLPSHAPLSMAYCIQAYGLWTITNGITGVLAEALSLEVVFDQKLVNQLSTSQSLHRDKCISTTCNSITETEDSPMLLYYLRVNA